jgi:hypothetical protein
MAATAATIAAYITVVVLLTTIDIRRSRREATDAERRLVAVLPYRDDGSRSERVPDGSGRS